MHDVHEFFAVFSSAYFGATPNWEARKLSEKRSRIFPDIDAAGGPLSVAVAGASLDLENIYTEIPALSLNPLSSVEVSRYDKKPAKSSLNSTCTKDRSMTDLADKERLPREIIAMRVAKELPDGSYVNLGIGIPTLVSSFLPEGRTVYYHSESGILNCGPLAEEGNQDIDLINAGGQFLEAVPGMAFFDSSQAFAMIRGGHVGVTVLGSHQVSAKGDLANWMLPQRGVGNVGGAMDLAAGASGVIVAMEHTDRENNPKIVEECTFPVTGQGCVYLIVTDLAVIERTEEGLLLKEVAPGWTPEEVQMLTGARLIIAEDVKEFEL